MGTFFKWVTHKQGGYINLAGVFQKEGTPPGLLSLGKAFPYWVTFLGMGAAHTRIFKIGLLTPLGTPLGGPLYGRAIRHKTTFK